MNLTQTHEFEVCVGGLLKLVVLKFYNNGGSVKPYLCSSKSAVIKLHTPWICTPSCIMLNTWYCFPIFSSLQTWTNIWGQLLLHCPGWCPAGHIYLWLCNIGEHMCISQRSPRLHWFKTNLCGVDKLSEEPHCPSNWLYPFLVGRDVSGVY